MTRSSLFGILAALVSVTVATACGGSDADRLNVGAECLASEDCDNSDDFIQTCLPQFAGGYCGLQDCLDDLDCPEDSACIAHTDGVNYCFRTCADKPECNRNRSIENESNCSSNVVFTDGANGRKACVPPSSGS
jgi:hypothetical protein